MRRRAGINALHLSRRGCADADRDRHVSNLLGKHHATCGRQHLRIANAGDWISSRHQDRAGDDRASEWGETYFIDADDGALRMTVA
jgi:hypothetical protein